ncbi:MAG: hypothetical protein ABSA42_16095 [Terracidiphilus sp.]|jgi:hypothetical protein
MITVSEIREHLVDLLASEDDKEKALSLFEDWLVQASWNMHQKSVLEAQQFVAEIELVLAENESDHEMLWKRLIEVLRAHPFSVSDKEAQVVRSGSSTTFKNHPGWPALIVGNSLAKAS